MQNFVESNRDLLLLAFDVAQKFATLCLEILIRDWIA